MADDEQIPAAENGNRQRIEAYANTFGGLASAGIQYANEIKHQFERLTLDDQGNVTVVTGQMTQQRDDQVVNNAGGYVFPVSDETRVRRFLILGTAGGTYYSTPQELTLDNVKALQDIIDRGKASMILREILEISLAGRNAKQEPMMLALALCARYRVLDCKHTIKHGSGIAKSYAEYILQMHKAALAIMNDVCRIPTHLFAFIEFCELVASGSAFGKARSTTGWGRLMRNAVCNWYESKSPEILAIHVTKYRQRNDWKHSDLFRLAHPKIVKYHEGTLEREQIYHYIAKGTLNVRKRRLPQHEYDVENPEEIYGKAALDREARSKALDLIEAYKGITKETPEDEIVEAVKKHGLVREHVPTEQLNSVAIWQALLEKMPMTALIRNLGKVSAIGALTKEITANIVRQLTDEEQLKRSRVHPIQILLAKTVYQRGRGDKGKLTWQVNEEIDKALEEAFYKSFINAPPTNKRICFAMDVSGSMCAPISGTMLSARTASAALSLISLRNEENVECVGFAHTLIELPYRGDWTIQRIENHMDSLPFGSTDCSLPMQWAQQNNKKFDVFIVYTDCETYFGEVHPFKALQNYREASGIKDAKLIVMGMTSSGFTIADPDDAGMLDIAGFDSAVPQLIHEFVTGSL